MLIKAINDDGEPESWDSRLEILQIHRSSYNFNQVFFWDHISTNQFADRAVKFALAINANLLFDCSNFDSFPLDLFGFVDQGEAGGGGGGLVCEL